MCLSDDNLADDQENITEPKRKRKQTLLTVSPSSESNNSSITKLNWINPFSARILWKTGIKKKKKHPILKGYISKTRTNSEFSSKQCCFLFVVIDKKIFIDKKRLTDKFYEGDYENENVQVPENNNSSDKKNKKKVSDFLSSEDSCDEWLP